MEMEDKPGGLSHVLAVLDAAGVNVEYMYAYVEKTKANAIVICKIDDREAAARSSAEERDRHVERGCAEGAVDRTGCRPASQPEACSREPEACSPSLHP